MAKAKTKSTRIEPPNRVRLEDVYRQLRDRGLEPNEVVQRLTALLRQWPSWIRYENFYGKKTWELLSVEFWQDETAILSVGIDTTDADCLMIQNFHYSHPSVSNGRPQFFMRADDIGREPHLDDDPARFVVSDYDPIAEFEREWKGQPRTPPRLPLMPAAPPKSPATPRKQRSRPRRDRADEAVRTLWPDGGPPADLENSLICRQVGDWLKANHKPGLNDTTILRAAGRKD